jgi:soluble P-type ATPase
MQIEITPGKEPLEIETIILDLNGTLSVGGEIPDGVKPRLTQLKELGFGVLFFSGDTRGDADELAEELGIDWRLAKTAEDKRDLALKMNPETCASIGNGLIDLELTRAVKLGIVTLQAEGVHVQTLLSADLVVPTINDALDLFIDPPRLVASLRQ